MNETTEDISSGDRYREFRAEQSAAYEANMRSPFNVVFTAVVVWGVPFLMLIPGAAEAIGLTFMEAFAAVGSVPLFLFAATLVYRFRGSESRLYVLFDDLETTSVTVSIGVCVIMSGDGASPLWFFYMMHAFVMGVHPGLRTTPLVIILATPVWVAGYFLFAEGFSANFALSLIAMSMAVFVASFSSSLQKRISLLGFDRAQLGARVSRLLVEQERLRIARDLHDGLTADLTAIAWKAEVQSKSMGADAGKEFGAIARRARAAIDDTRSVVTALRGEPIQWPALESHVASRCAELCDGRVSLKLECETDRGGWVPGELGIDIVRMVQESVRNALEHGEPSAIRVVLHVDDRVLIDVEDDGVGIEPTEGATSTGGLANLKRRAADYSGTLQIESLNPGTRIRIILPTIDKQPALRESLAREIDLVRGGPV